MDEKELENVPVLIFANKQDLVHALDSDDVQELLYLDDYKKREWMVIACSAKTKEGLDDGFDWVITQMKKNKKN